MNGALVMAYGTPPSLDDVEAYFTHIRHGRTPPAEAVADLQRRYEAIGGTSPLRAITEAQRARIADALGEGWVVEVGMKHAAPFVEDAVSSLESKGVERIVGVVLAPHYSRGSVGEYVERVKATSTVPVGVRRVLVEPARVRRRSWQRRSVRCRRGRRCCSPRTRCPSGCSTATRIPTSCTRRATAVAAEAGLDRWAGWGLAWQSAGRTPEPWRGPDLLEVLDDLAATGRADGVVVCPQGFVADHLEVLYDLDVVAAERAASLGLAFRRTRSLNDDPTVLAALAERVRARREEVRRRRWRHHRAGGGVRAVPRSTPTPRSPSTNPDGSGGSC